MTSTHKNACTHAGPCPTGEPRPSDPAEHLCYSAHGVEMSVDGDVAVVRLGVHRRCANVPCGTHIRELFEARTVVRVRVRPLVRQYRSPIDAADVSRRIGGLLTTAFLRGKPHDATTLVAEIVASDADYRWHCEPA